MTRLNRNPSGGHGTMLGDHLVTTVQELEKNIHRSYNENETYHLCPVPCTQTTREHMYRHNTSLNMITSIITNK